MSPALSFVIRHWGFEVICFSDLAAILKGSAKTELSDVLNLSVLMGLHSFSKLILFSQLNHFVVRVRCLLLLDAWSWFKSSLQKDGSSVCALRTVAVAFTWPLILGSWATRTLTLLHNGELRELYPFVSYCARWFGDSDSRDNENFRILLLDDPEDRGR
jgi:hypothetical protein